MTDCDYCSETFTDEDAYLDHLASIHRDELGRIDQKRIERRFGSTENDDGPSQLVLYGIGVVFLLIIVGTVALVLTMADDDAEENIHDHGYITLEIDGEYYDFDREPYYTISNSFHFHQNDPHNEPEDGNYWWHLHPPDDQRLTLGESMAEIDMPITETSITVDGETYDHEDDDTSVTITVDGEEASPDDEVHDGDHIEITVETGE